MTRIFLGIESSCDDTAAALVSDDRQILSNVIVDQNALHEAFGGVVPEIAARAHAEKLDVAIEQAVGEAGISLNDVNTIAVTSGPGLIGGVLSGVMTARGIAAGLRKPLIGVNHLAGHALTPRLTDDLTFPYLLLLVSGGHCQLLISHAPDRFERLGGTIDDAPGEAFDKVARMLGLSQPGGPAVQKEAEAGDEGRFRLPRPLLDREGCDMSFSGLKTAVRRERDRLVEANGGLPARDRSDLCAGFQAAVADVVVEKVRRAIQIYLSQRPKHPAVAVAGGVAANTAIRSRLQQVCADHDLIFVAPPLALCTDNAAMIAWAGIELDRIDHRGMDPLVPRPRWPLDDSATPILGSGKKGAKA